MTSGMKRSASMAGLAPREAPAAVRACAERRDSSSAPTAHAWQLFVTSSLDSSLHVIDVDPRCDVDDFRAAVRAKLSLSADQPLDVMCGCKFISAGDAGFSMADAGVSNGSTVRVMPREALPRRTKQSPQQHVGSHDDYVMQRAGPTHPKMQVVDAVAAVVAAASAVSSAAHRLSAAAHRVASTAAAVGGGGGGGGGGVSTPVAWQEHAAAMADFTKATAATAAAAERVQAADEVMSSPHGMRVDLHSRSGKRHVFSIKCFPHHDAGWLAAALSGMCRTLDAADTVAPASVEPERSPAAAVFAVRSGARYSLVATPHAEVAPARVTGVLPADTPLRAVLGPTTASPADIVVQELA